MPFTLSLHPKFKKDVNKLPWQDKNRVGDAIKERLTTNPHSFGIPLRGKLTGYLKMRIGNYRIVFRVSKMEIYILGVGHRSYIYDELERRIGL